MNLNLIIVTTTMMLMLVNGIVQRDGCLRCVESGQIWCRAECDMARGESDAFASRGCFRACEGFTSVQLANDSSGCASESELIDSASACGAEKRSEIVSGSFGYLLFIYICGPLCCLFICIALAVTLSQQHSRRHAKVVAQPRFSDDPAANNYNYYLDGNGNTNVAYVQPHAQIQHVPSDAWAAPSSSSIPTPASSSSPPPASRPRSLPTPPPVPRPQLQEQPQRQQTNGAYVSIPLNNEPISY